MQAQENHLEQALRQAANEPGFRSYFYAALWAADVYVIGELEPSGKMGTPERMTIENWNQIDGIAIVPFFSSLSALQRAINEECGYLKLSARKLFEITRGAALVLNPMSDYAKEFSAGEIDELLLGELNRLPDKSAVKKEAQLLLGQPRAYPSELVDALTGLLATRDNVEAAYLVLMGDPAADDGPHLLVGILAGGDTERLMLDAGTRASSTAPAGPAVKFTLVVPGEDGLSEYFLSSVIPFYERKWGERLNGYLGIGHA